MKKYNAFVSYASEDESFATELVGALKSRGFKIWYAQSNLSVGQNILDSIEEGMSQSTYGILILSKSYFNKGWPTFEFNTLMRSSIEKKTRLLPIWHGVTKEEVEKFNLGLAGIHALKSDYPLRKLVEELTRTMATDVPTIGIIPIYESPKYRFLQGIGAVKIGHQDGPATTLWELLIHLNDDQYPISIENEIYTKEELLIYAVQTIMSNPEIAKSYVNEEEYNTIWKMCEDIELDSLLTEDH